MPNSPHYSEQVASHGVLHEPVPSSEPARASQVRPIPSSSPLSSPSPRALPPPTLPSAPSLSLSSSSTLSNSSHSSTSSGSPNPPLAPPQPLRTHPMVTRAQNNIFKPKQLFHTTPTPATTYLEPTCVSQALKEPVWRQAMSEEFTALVRQGTWELVPPTPDQHLIGCKWVFRVKRGKDGSIESYKARLVAKGFHQRPGFDYFNTFSPVIKPTTIRTVLSLAVSHGWPIQHLDVNNAFLHGKLEETLYMQQPPGFVDSDKPHFVCRLTKSLYGLKQAPRAWFRELKAFILSQGFYNSKSDSSLFVYHKDSTRLYFLVYADDILLTGNDSSLLRSLVHKMGQCFSLKDLGPFTFFLGIEAIQTPAGLLLSQHKYILDILCRANMDAAKLVSTPLPFSANLSSSAGSALSNSSEYRCILGSLQYLTLTRPDISFAVSRLSQYMHQPTDLHWQALKRVLRYLRGTVYHGLLLRPQPSLSLHAYSDSDWAGDRDSSISTTSYVVFLGSNPISWRAAKQQAVARSSTEAKYRALAATASELIWVRNLLSELGVSVPRSPAIFCDNVSATYLSVNPVLHSRMKHIAIDLHFVRDLMDRGFLHVSHISTHDQLADGLTKPLSSARFCLLRSKLGIADSFSVLRGRYQINHSTSQKETKSHQINYSTSQTETKSP
ncbi:hypothetical protein SLEP1_g45935 [Rubroshorea leprosula]|uniref:Reverse transcriptase Ty1/copia-type domain-containing protein n=1 Tax=Rubroshorea leprosula TaxID=152421 RepID=A0AAV5LMG7_9ROSI|nr:hypothetical protein SLEP1_g45935 [Rubroshorea leprosula]